MSNAAIFKITVQGLGCGTENCLLIKELDKYIYKHIIMIPACIENLPSEAKNPLNYWELNKSVLLKKLTVRMSKAKRNKLEAHDELDIRMCNL